MSSFRIRQRISNVENIGTATLYGHVLRFHKKSKDGSAKCDIFKTSNPSDRVHGVLYKINSIDKQKLDGIEGLGFGYSEKSVSVLNSNSKNIEALAYFATDIDENLLPYHWYKEHIVRGAAENRLAANYINELAMVRSIPDPDKQRHLNELAIYS